MVCADDRWGQSGGMHRRAGRGSRAVSTAGAVEQYASTGPVGQSGGMRRQPEGAVGRHRRAWRGSRSGLQILVEQVVTQTLPQGPSGFQACLGSKAAAVLQLLVQPQR